VLFLAGASPLPATWEGFSLKEAVRRYEKRIIERALRDVGGLVTRAARLLGYVNHNTLIKKLSDQYPELLSARKTPIPRRHSLIFIKDTSKESRHLNILHVEDNRTIADTVKEMLEREGWAVEACADGTTAQEKLSGETHYDVLIFDNKLPGADGIELTRQTRQLSHRRQVPIIMLSASNVEMEARQAGANAFLKKPEEIIVIAETIARLLASKPKQTKKGKHDKKRSR
jgi:CheY-like chemotaxis protein